MLPSKVGKKKLGGKPNCETGRIFRSMPEVSNCTEETQSEEVLQERSRFGQPILYGIIRDYGLNSAIQIVVMGREMVDGWAKYRIVVEQIFKKGLKGSSSRRGETWLWVNEEAVLCKCPKIKVGRRYLLLGKWRMQ